MSKDSSAQKTILVVDDDEIFRETLCSGLEAAYNVLPASNAKEALAIINRIHIDLLLTDVRMPGMSGYELIEWINLHVSRRIPFIFMTGYISLTESEDESLYTFKTIAKPFKMAELKQAIESRLDESDNEISEQVAENRFCRVPLSDIVIKPVLDFDIYLQLSDQNFVKVAYKNEELPLAQIRKFKQKGVKYLYIRKDDFHKFVQFTFDLAKAVNASPDISPARKLSFLQYANKVMMEKVFNEGIDRENYESVAEFVSLSVSTVVESKDALNLLEVLKDVGGHVDTDSFASALYSVLIARELNFESALTAFKLSMAGLFQDIGKKEIDRDLIEKDTADLSKKELSILESHVVRSQKILESFNFIHSDIIRLIQEHHEDLEGRGYPFGKKRSDQHPLSKILQCSNIFIDKMNSVKRNTGRVDVGSVLTDMEKNHKSKLDPDCVKALRALFKIPAVGAEA